MGEAAFRRVWCGAKGDSPRDSGQKRRKHVGSPRFAESAFTRKPLRSAFFRLKELVLQERAVGVLAVADAGDLDGLAR